MNPFTDIRDGSVAALGETGLIELIRSELSEVQPEPPYDIGDDCARLVPGERNLLTVDSVHYKYHFDASTRPEDVAAKLLKRNLSDIAAMGGTPLEAVLAWHLPAKTSIEWVRHFLVGLSECALEYKTHIVGGDVAQTDSDLCISLTLTGHTTSDINRRGAKAGDYLLVTGKLGGSIKGGHLDFCPRLSEGRELAHEAKVKAMIDLSDGLAKDLLQILPDGCVAALELQSLPVSDDAAVLSDETGQPAWKHALCDGEDYELLFAVDGGVELNALLDKWNRNHDTQISCIGKISESSAEYKHARLIDASTNQPLEVSGYKHLG